MAAHNELGKEGETAAVSFLQQKGYLIRHTDWHDGKKDLDIVAEKDHTLIVIEVKTRRNDKYGQPQEAVTDRKIRHIVSSTDSYLNRFEIDLPVRFDIITLIGERPPFDIEHIENAFLPPIW
ncbi:YraN family protein [Bacteroides sp. ET225]|uniref:YraN family protein n=1 Tax=Bacteroides sp. ET225 TaxID=2972461 RepID=UPI001DDFCE06|nr:YraN family protein [Bacteroides sp. ET225]MBW9199256.1 endonuclease [Bacteroidales bacterium SW299]MCR8918873.1 YraN family protein [Bacteroides sp. ET225]